MESVLLFIFLCMLSLMFLGMLYGERLSMIGLFDGDWLGPVSGVFGRLWSGLCQGIDESIEFVLAHLSWVVAAVSGTAGLVIIAFLMGGGLASDAAAYHADTLKPLRSGGVIDKVDAVVARAPGLPVLMAKAERDDSQFVSQVRTADYMVFGRPEYSPIRPKPRRPIEGSISYPPSSITDRAILDVTFRRLGATVVRSELNPDVVTRGRLVDSLPDPFFVDRVVARLRADNWRESFGLPRDDAGLPQEALPESPLAAVRDLEDRLDDLNARVRITPGTFVSEQDLRVEKTVPEQSATGDVTVQLLITNLGTQDIDGIVVREILPIRTQVRGAVPNAVLRDETLTWLIDDLRSGEERMLRFTVIPSGSLTAGTRRETLFESLTEVSALTAVASPTRVRGGQPVLEPQPDPFPVDRRRRESAPRRELVGTPNLELVIEEPAVAAPVGEWTRILFTLANTGTADATGIRLRLTLDSGLDHADLLNRPRTQRQVFVDVDQVAVGKSRRFRLEVRPVTRGEAVSTAEVILAGNRVARETFRLVARDAADPRLRPENAIR